MLKYAIRVVALTAVLFVAFSSAAQACSVFAVSDSGNVFFGSNEDGQNGNTYVWFLPAGKGSYGAVYFSYEDAWVQGGMNEKGLALDWANTEPQQMAVYPERVSPAGNKGRLLAGNLNETILKTCATVGDVIDLYGGTNEIAFENAHVLVADRSGASAIFEWHDGKFEIIRRTAPFQAITNFNITNAASQGYSCIRYDYIHAVLGRTSPITFSDAKNALMLASDSLTQYSYICDLKNGLIYLYDKRNFARETVLSLQDELAKGKHIRTTGLEDFSISPKYREMGPINNQNVLAVGRGATEIWAICILCAVLGALALIFVKRNRLNLLPAAADVAVIALGLGLMRYGYFLRYGFTFIQTALLALPILLIALAIAQLAISIAALIRGKGWNFALFYANTAFCLIISWIMLDTIIL